MEYALTSLFLSRLMLHLRGIATYGEDIFIGAHGTIITMGTIDEEFGSSKGPVRTFGGTESPWRSRGSLPSRRGLSARNSRHVVAGDLEDLDDELAWEELELELERERHTKTNSREDVEAAPSSLLGIR